MPEFLAETYAPRGASPPRAGDVALAAGQASGPEGLVRFLGAVNVPEEETCFWLYQAPTAGAVRAAMTGAGLRPERIIPAVTLRPPNSAPGAAPSTSHTTRPPTVSPGPQGTSSGPHQNCPPPLRLRRHWSRFHQAATARPGGKAQPRVGGS